MFDIRLVSRTPERQEEGWDAVWGEIRLGEFRERFRAPLDPWTPADYERQWRAAAERLLGGQPSAFWTIPWQFWWVMWPEGDEAVMHEELLLPDRIKAGGYTAEPAAGTAPYELIGPRESLTDDGEPVSEWRVALTAVRVWLDERV